MIIKNIINFPILKRLIPSIYKRYIFLTGNFLVEKKINGIIYLLDTRHLIDRNFYLRENYEDKLYYLAKNLIISNKVSIFLDIGSCWGIYSLRLSKIKRLKIYSFEPVKKNIQRFLKMIKKNNLKNIKIFKTALGNKRGNVRLYGDDYFTPNFSIYEKKSKNISNSKIDKLDNLIKFNNKVLYLKVDIEGHEYPFILGAKNLLRKNKVILQIEIFPKNRAKMFKYLNKHKLNIIYSFKDDFIFSNFKIKKKGSKNCPF